MRNVKGTSTSGIAIVVVLLIIVAGILIYSYTKISYSTSSVKNYTQSSDSINASGQKSYLYTDPYECSVIRFMCVQGKVPFSDETGCGCQDVFDDETPIPVDIGGGIGDGKIQAFDCTRDSRNADFCTEEYSPVCGWFNSEVIKCIRYPCAQTYSNKCLACKNENVISYTQGECPA